jgi:DnaK suppressor protein
MAARGSRTTPAGTAPGALPDGTAAWTDGELAEVRGELDGQARVLREEIGAAEAAAAALQREQVGEGSGDEADAGSRTFGREHERTLADNSRELLVQVERALARLDDGSYGGCERCGQAIPKPRLQAFPRATLCVGCKSREERR